jgi:hypothetical protein
MLPLGDAWEGLCKAIPDRPWEPADTTLLTCCNLGYARGCCGHFPEDDGADAIRFVIAGDDAAGLHLYYVLERDHHPLAHGPLEFSPDGAVLDSPLANHPIAVRLAGAYVESYLRRKSEASGYGTASG